MTDQAELSDDEFVVALEARAERYLGRLTVSEIARLRDYYEQVMAWNPRLHLVAPCAPAEFAVRHVLESLFALNFLPHKARVIDVGSGAGLPVIPCLIVRPLLRATLFESSPKKAVFLREVLRRVNLSEAAEVIAERFEKTAPPAADFVTCRALDRFADLLKTLVVWSPPASRLLLFGGPALGAQIEKEYSMHTAIQIPDSRQRYIYMIDAL